jgi:hypothetical protein
MKLRGPGFAPHPRQPLFKKITYVCSVQEPIQQTFPSVQEPIQKTFPSVQEPIQQTIRI